jgi:RND superfamily putative drug exporter
VFLARRGSATFVGVGLRADGLTPEQIIPPLRARTESLNRRFRPAHPDLSLRWTGEIALNVDMREASTASVRAAEVQAIPLTLLLLLVAFGAIVAALVPLLSGALAITLALGAAALVARAWPVSILVQSVVTMLGLGLGIDYALLMVSRFREALRSGHSADEGAELAARHAGRTILVSAATVLVGFAALLLVPLNEIRAIAVGGILVLLSSTLIATTLLPGLLASLGRRVDLGRLRFRGQGQAAADRWRRLGCVVSAHPWWALLVGGGPVLFLALQAGHLRIGVPRGNWLPPEMESSRGMEELRVMGHGGAIQGIRVVLVLPAGAPAGRSAGWKALTRVQAFIASDPRVERVRSMVDVAHEAGMGRTALAILPDSMSRGLVSPDGQLALLEVLPAERLEPSGMMDLVRDIRSNAAAEGGVAGARVLVGGLPAFNLDYREAASGWFDTVVVLVVGGTLVALFAGTRSILVPAKAVALNLLSVAAAFGALRLVFQDGYGARLLGVSEPLGAVFSTLPVIVFCIVFGLSMDYEVFLVTRVREERLAGRSEAAAIVEALVATGPVITSAAAIMVVVFGAFTTGHFLFVKMLGFTLAVAVLLDATVVRTVIGPALLQLAGRWNWWPGSLRPVDSRR